VDNEKIITKQFLITPAAGKRLIAKSMLFIPAIKKALENKTIVIIAGTTNGYVAEELLGDINQAAQFSRKRFFRGVTMPSRYPVTDMGRLSSEDQFPSDVVIINGKWEKGLTIFDVVDSLKKGDIIIKGANALDIENKQAGIFIGHPKAGTINAVMQAVLGRRVELYLPIGLEKRIIGNINTIAQKLNSPNTSGLRMFPVTGNIITELDAINIITKTNAELVAAGGVCGAEGSCWIAASGNEQQIGQVKSLIQSICEEPNFLI